LKTHLEQESFTDIPLYEIKYTRQFFCNFGTMLWLLLAIMLIFIMFQNPIAFIIASIPLYAIYFRLSLLFKNINIKIYLDRINISGKDYDIDRIIYKERSGNTKTTIRIGEFYHDNQRIEQFLVTAEFCSRITSFDEEKLNQYLQALKDKKDIQEKFDFTKEQEEKEYYTTTILWIIIFYFFIISIILIAMILNR